ncbi:hypothetical protein NM688_g6089 [Phlebia brevispora]|uniref:Uncharacterized protein n=1 Tax=Phlebia brevispora TaxID=194682 RepID=A0ACC1SJV8_9APHY|nr:hypothetical protein NM688_g6089 [Phlebia brevispora]
MSATPTSSSILSSATSSSSVDPNNSYGYTPNSTVGVVFTALFAVTTFVHFIQMLKYRMWWLLPTVLLGGAGEIIGWVGRLWSSFNVDARDPYMMQIVCTIIAPTPFIAAIFITFGRLVGKLGDRYSWLPPLYYGRIFLACDIMSLVIQAAGGGIAASANTTSDQNLGGNIMLAGIVIQMVALFLFMILATQFFISFLNNSPVRGPYDSPDGSLATLSDTRPWDDKLKFLSAGLAFISGVLMIRAVYRTIELADGWTGPVITHQVYFVIFDGGMVIAAMLTLNVCHPGRLLFNRPEWIDGEKQMYRESAETEESLA